MSERPDADVVIVAHNAGALLLDAVRSAAEQAGEERVWVMDAESTDGSVAPVGVAFPSAHVVEVANRGFSASNNRGIEATSGEWVLLLNPDAVLEPGALQTLVSAAEADERIGVVAPLVMTPDGRVQDESFGRFPSFATRAGKGLVRIGQRLRGRGTPEPAVPARATDVDWVTGACMLVRRSAIDTVGPMDEGFFLYYEDIEWCHRMHDRGFRVILEPAAHCVHHLGQSDAPSDFVARAYRESFYRYCDLYGLWGLKASARFALGLRRLAGGRV